MPPVAPTLAPAQLPDGADLDKVADEGLRQEIAAFLAAEQATELAQRDQISRIWNDNVAILRSEKKVNDWEKSKAAGEMLRVLTQVSPAVLSGTFAELMKSQPEAALKVVGGLSRKIQNETHAAAAQRIDNLRAQTVDKVDIDIQRLTRKLGWAAQLHEIGFAISHSDYHKHGAYILDNADDSGIQQSPNCTDSASWSWASAASCASWKPSWKMSCLPNSCCACGWRCCCATPAKTPTLAPCA